MVIRLSLAVFDCSQDSFGDHSLDIDPSVSCWSGKGDHTILFPAGVVTLVLYGLGIPAGIASIFYRYRAEIYVDQGMFERGVGGTAVRTATVAHGCYSSWAGY